MKLSVNKLLSVFISIVLLTAYVISVIYLDDVKILAGNITPIVNLSALLALTAIGLAVSILLIKFAPHNTFNFLFQDKVESKRRNIYLLLAVLALFRIAAFLLSPDFIQYMRVWPDSTEYLSDMHTVLQDPIRIFDRKSPIYTIWLIINHLTFGKIIGVQGSGVYFGVSVYYSDIIPPIFFQNIIGVVSALICFSIFSKINTKLAYAVTLLAFLNPTALAIENAILRESLALFFILSGFALFLKAVKQQNGPLYGFMSGILFVLAYQTRPELVIVYSLLCSVLIFYTLFYKQKLWRTIILFCFPLALSIFLVGYQTSHRYVYKTYGGRFGVAIFGLKSRCYFYESPTFPELIKNIQKRTTQCEYERKAPCDDPAPSVFVLKTFIDKEIYNYMQNKGLQFPNDEIRDQMHNQIRDQIFLDIVKNNSFCYAKSLLTNVGYNLIHNVHNMTPILYGRDNYWVSQNWNYYVSPKMLVLYENYKSYDAPIVYLFKTIELHATRKILFPFFLIGSVIILISSNKRRLLAAGNNSLLICVLLISWMHILFISVMANPVARFIYPILPFIFTIEIIGVVGVYRWLKWMLLQQMGGAGQTSATEVVRDMKEQKKVNWNSIVGVAITLIFITSATILVLFKTKISYHNKKLSAAYAAWTMDEYSEGNIKDAQGKFDAIPVNVKIIDGRLGKARYFNGKDSHVKTSLTFQNWKALTISLWVKPEQKDGKELSVILDNGHDANSNFAIQSADINNPNSGKWVFHCNGIDISLTLPFNQWTHVAVSINAEKGIIQAYTNGISAGKVTTGKGFEFGAAPLMIGKLAKSDSRYFKGAIDEVVILDKTVAKWEEAEQWFAIGEKYE